MAVNFAQAFGANTNNRGNGSKVEDLPVAQYWLNVGYTIDVRLEDGTSEVRFVSLPVGIPLDTMKLLSTKSQNDAFADFQSARNDLHQQMMDVCKELAPGEEKIISLSEDNGLAIQLRRVNEAKAPVKAADNMFSKRLAFA